MAGQKTYGSTGVLSAIRALIDPELENDLNQALGTNESLKEVKIANILSVQILNELVRLNLSIQQGMALLSITLEEKSYSKSALKPEITVMPTTVTEVKNADTVKKA